jgi:hypothetical protein
MNSSHPVPIGSSSMIRSSAAAAARPSLHRNPYYHDLEESSLSTFSSSASSSYKTAHSPSSFSFNDVATSMTIQLSLFSFPPLSTTTTASAAPHSEGRKMRAPRKAAPRPLIFYQEGPRSGLLTPPRTPEEMSQPAIEEKARAAPTWCWDREEEARREEEEEEDGWGSDPSEGEEKSRWDGEEIWWEDDDDDDEEDLNNDERSDATVALAEEEFSHFPLSPPHTQQSKTRRTSISSSISSSSSFGNAPLLTPSDILLEAADEDEEAFRRELAAKDDARRGGLVRKSASTEPVGEGRWGLWTPPATPLGDGKEDNGRRKVWAF